MARWVLNITWSDVPHLSEEDKAVILSGMLPHEVDARSKGIPQLGAGAIYPVPEDDILVNPFRIPDHWPRTYALDVGWKKTAALFGAYDEKTDTWYLYDEYYRGYAEPSVHADAIKSRGSWMRGLIGSGAGASSQKDGKSMLSEYARYGLDLAFPNKAIEAGILECYQRLSTGRVKVFKNLGNFLAEFRVYRRKADGFGTIDLKQADHLMDAFRYLIMSGKNTLELPPSDDNNGNGHWSGFSTHQGRSNICGY